MATLQSLVKQHHLTLNILVQGIWALLLSRYSGESDIVFGTTVSGRPADLAGVESMIGLFINTLPMRCKILPGVSLWSWLGDVQVQYFEQQQFENCSSGQIHQWIDIPGSRPLYESLLVFENYPVNSSPTRTTLDITGFRSIGAQTRHALTILVTPGVELGIHLIFAIDRLDPPDVSRVLEHWVAMLESIVAVPDQRLEALISRIPVEQAPSIKTLQTHGRETGSVPARNFWEAQLVQVWEEVLGIQPIGVQDNFFALGGHSLLALRLMARIQQEFGQNLPLAVLFQGATVAHLADVLRQGVDARPWSALVPIQTQGEQRPFFCVPGIGGNVLYFYELARYLGPDQPFYGLQSVGLDGESKPYTRVEDMAAHYIKALQTVQPRGPYLLGGHSFGGPVAFEMAQQLLKQGEKVALVAIFDTPPGMDVIPVRLTWDDAQWLAYIARLAERQSGKELGVSYEVLQPLPSEEQLRYFGERLQAGGWLPPGKIELAQLRGLVRVLKANSSVGYKPRDVHPTRVALFRASEQLPEEEGDIVFPEISTDPTMGWAEFARDGVKVYKVPGNHLTMMTVPNVQVLAEQLRACLKEAQEGDDRAWDETHSR